MGKCLCPHWVSKATQNIMKLPPFQFENDNSWLPKPGRKKEINTDRPQVQIKAERKLDFFSSGTFHLSFWSFYKHS